jgi:hypothetical protein
MNKQLNVELSQQIAKTTKSKAKKPFDSAYKAALVTDNATYVQGFLVFSGQPFRPVEHAWIEVEDSIIDPTFPHFNRKPEDLFYFPAHSISVSELKEIVDESKEDYPEDDPLPVYGDAPYDYYGDIMLGGKNYLEAYQAAEAKCREINKPITDNN